MARGRRKGSCLQVWLKLLLVLPPFSCCHFLERIGCVVHSTDGHLMPIQEAVVIAIPSGKENQVVFISSKRRLRASISLPALCRGFPPHDLRSPPFRLPSSSQEIDCTYRARSASILSPLFYFIFSFISVGCSRPEPFPARRGAVTQLAIKSGARTARQTRHACYSTKLTIYS